MQFNLDNTIKVLTKYATILNEKYGEKLPDVTGEIRNTLKSGVKVDINGVHVYLNLEDYWYYLEFGRKPGKFPPVDKMLQYVRDVPIIPEPYQLPSGKTVIPTESQLAFLIGRKIANEGTPANHYLQLTLNEIMVDLYNEVKIALREDLINDINLTFKIR